MQIRIRVKTKEPWTDSMVSKIFEESPACRWIMERGFKKGFEEGRQQGLQKCWQVLVRYVQRHFPVLAPLAEERAARMEDFEVLNDMLDTLIDAKTIEEARRILEEGVRPDAVD